jgi:hypothetical protein
MEPKAKKTYIILSLISIILGGVVVILALLDFKDPVIVVVPAAVSVMLIVTIMWVVFVRIRQKERNDFVLAKKHRPYDQDAEYQPYDPSKAQASKEAIFCEYCEARIDPSDTVCSSCGKPKDRFAGTKLS